jgi:hypothetical protein
MEVIVFDKCIAAAALCCLLIGLADPTTTSAQPRYQFLPEIRLNGDTATSHYQFTGFGNCHCIAEFGGNPYILWQGNQDPDTLLHVYLSRSTDRGISFLPEVRVDVNPAYHADYYGPAMLIDSTGIIYAAWTEWAASSDRIVISRSTDGGATFNARVWVDSNGDNYPGLPALAGRGDTVYCTWVAERSQSNSTLTQYVARSTDRGVTFGTPVIVDTSSNLLIAQASIATDGAGRVFVAWRDDRSNHQGYPYHVYCARSLDGGVTFTPAVRCDVPGAVSGTFACVGVDRSGQHVYTAHKERLDSGDYGIFVGASSDGGVSFQTGLRLDTAGAGSDAPNLAVSSSGRVVVTWMDYRSGASPSDVYFAYSTDGGSGFSISQRANARPNSSTLWAPQVAIGAGETAYVCWTDGYMRFAKGVPGSQGISEATPHVQAPFMVLGPNSNPARHDVLFRARSAEERLPAEVRIYDETGRERVHISGIGVLPWNLGDETGRPVSPGIYFYRWTFGSARGTGKLTVIRD